MVINWFNEQQMKEDKENSEKQNSERRKWRYKSNDSDKSTFMPYDQQYGIPEAKNLYRMKDFKFCCQDSTKPQNISDEACFPKVHEV